MILGFGVFRTLRAKNQFHGIGEGKFFDEDEKVDRVSLDISGFPNPKAIFDEEIPTCGGQVAEGEDLEVVMGELS